MIHLKLAKETDLMTIADMAKQIWNQHYVAMVGQEQVNYMLNKFYNQQSLCEQLHIKKHQFYLIKNNEENIGFLSISPTNEQHYFLHKFYIYQHKANKGAGTKTLNALLEIIKPKTLTLTVNRKNYKSINFYFKNGFKIDRVEDFDIGNHYEMNDFVMIKTCN